MAFTQHLTRRWEGVGRQIEVRQSFSGDGELSPREVSIPDSTSDMLVNLAVDVDKLKYIFLLSDQDLTFETNDAESPDDTINLKANNPYIWYDGSYDALKLTEDVTGVYLSNSSGATATLKIEGVEDATP